jgi:hypothetical protein
MKRLQVRLVSLVCGCAVAGTSLSALEWPVQTPKVVSLFGQRSRGVIEPGIVLENVETVQSAGNGSILMTLETNMNMSGFPGTLGNAVILSHDEGLLTVYGNLSSIDRANELTHVETGTFLATAGTTAWGYPSSCIFQVIDSEQKALLNPLMLLPLLPDQHGPSIKNVIVAKNDQIYALGTTKSVRQGKYRIYADIPDTITGFNDELAPFRISVQVNGAEQASVPFEILTGNAGRLSLSNSAYTWNEMYKDPDRIYLGELTLSRGRADIAVIARDIAGNERSVLFGLQIE